MLPWDDFFGGVIEPAEEYNQSAVKWSAKAMSIVKKLWKHKTRVSMESTDFVYYEFIMNKK